MRKRNLGRTGLQITEVSLGTEYLMDKPQDHSIAVIHAAIDAGINYFDLFGAGPDFRDAMGEAFKPYRKDVYLAAHLGATVNDDGQYRKTRVMKHNIAFFEDFLARYETDYVDVLMLHNCDRQNDYDKLFGKPLDYALEQKRKGTARFLGFSGHTVSTALQAVQSGYIDVLMFPVNMAGNAVEGKRDLLQACVANNVGLIAMKPYGGGKLLQGPRTVKLAHYQMGGESVKLQKNEPITPVQCLSYTLSQIGVTAAVPGCANVEELQAALAYEQATDTDKDYADIITDFEQYVAGVCTYCNHCLPCPALIDIGQTLRLLDIAQGGALESAKAAYALLEHNASDCIECGACEERCPFGVPVRERMAEAQNVFA